MSEKEQRIEQEAETVEKSDAKTAPAATDEAQELDADALDDVSAGWFGQRVKPGIPPKVTPLV